MWAAVLIIAGGRPHYCDRPPESEFYTIFSLREKLLSFENIQINLVFCSLIRNFAGRNINIAAIIMNKNERFVITINRELGSGGRTVGRKLAEKLGVEFCDKLVIKGLQKEYNLSVEEIERQKGESSSWWTEVKRALNVAPGMVGSVAYAEAMNNEGMYPPTTKEMFQTETRMLQDIAEQESLVVAGRSGFYVFRNHPNHLNILIQASMPFRVERVMRKQGLSEDEARKIIEQVDQMRESYVKKYTNTSRYDTRNYDLVMTADGKTEDELVADILKFIG